MIRFPIKAITIGNSTAGIHSFQGHYATRDTRHFGAPKNKNQSTKVTLDDGEVITGISGEFLAHFGCRQSSD